MDKTRRAQTFDGQSNEKVADIMAGCAESSKNDQMAKAEFFLRQTNAIMNTAEHTKRYTRYMFWSVIILATSSLAQIIVALLQK